jgi:hypothetical protein
MPGQLRSDAKCPVCGFSFGALVDTSNVDGVMREYHHYDPDRKSSTCCKRFFKNHDAANMERRALEMPVAPASARQSLYLVDCDERGMYVYDARNIYRVLCRCETIANAQLIAAALNKT